MQRIHVLMSNYCYDYRLFSHIDKASDSIIYRLRRDINRVTIEKKLLNQLLTEKSFFYYREKLGELFETLQGIT